MVNLRGSSSWHHLDGAMLNQSVKWKSRAKPFGAIKMWQRVLMLGLVIIGLSTASARAQDDIGAASTVFSSTDVRTDNRSPEPGENLSNLRSAFLLAIPYLRRQRIL